MLDYNRKVAKRRSAITSRVIQMMHCSKIFTGHRYLQSCLLPHASRTLLQYLQSLKGTQKKYSMNTLYNEMIGLYRALYHLGHLNRHPHASHLGRLYTGFPRCYKSPYKLTSVSLYNLCMYRVVISGL